MASPSQEINTLREEIGYQHAILNSLQGADDAVSKRARISARREIQMLEDRLQRLLRTWDALFCYKLYRCCASRTLADWKQRKRDLQAVLGVVCAKDCRPT